MPFEFESKEHFFKDSSGKDIEPIAQIPEEGGGDHHDHAHAHGEFDVHIWLDPFNAKKIVEEVAHELADLDPKNSNICQFLPASGVCVVYSLKDVTKYCFVFTCFSLPKYWFESIITDSDAI